MIVIALAGSQLTFYRLKETFSGLIPMKEWINQGENFSILIGQTLLKIKVLQSRAAQKWLQLKKKVKNSDFHHKIV